MNSNNYSYSSSEAYYETYCSLNVVLIQNSDKVSMFLPPSVHSISEVTKNIHKYELQ